MPASADVTASPIAGRWVSVESGDSEHGWLTTVPGADMSIDTSATDRLDSDAPAPRQLGQATPSRGPDGGGPPFYLSAGYHVHLAADGWVILACGCVIVTEPSATASAPPEPRGVCAWREIAV